MAFAIVKSEQSKSQSAAPKINPLTRRPAPTRPSAKTSTDLAAHQSSRDKLTVILRRHLKRSQHVLLVGAYGSGRTWMLNQMALAFPDAMQITLSQSKRAIILSVCQRMWADEVLFIDNASDWKTAAKKLQHHTIPQLCELIAEHLHGYKFILDDLDAATEKTVLEIIKPLLGGTVLATADISTPAKRKRVAGILDRFKQIDMPPLDDQEARTMLWRQLDRSAIKYAATVEKKVLRIAGGRPGVIFDLCEQLRGSGGTLADIRDLEHSNTQIRRVNLGVPLILAAFIFLMAGRYIFRSYDDGSLVVLASIGSVASSILLRPLLYKMLLE